MRFFATTPKGMEHLLEKELRAFGLKDLKTTRAGIEFEGTIADAYHVNLWSRTANRVLFPLKTFDCPDEAKLYGGVKSIRWSDHLDTGKTLAVDFSSTKSAITHTRFGALKTKDAIVDQFRSVTGERPSVDPARPSVRINVYVLENRATVSIDLSGDSLHMRGYRTEGASAPLKENLAAALLLAMEWPEMVAAARAENRIHDLTFLDPMCGSGTLLIEAAAIAANRAPGALRRYWGFQGWKQHDRAGWQNLLSAAQKGEITDPKNLPRIAGGDLDPHVLHDARGNAKNAGYLDWIQITKKEAREWKTPSTHGLLLVNPPYGERIGELEELKVVHKGMGDMFKQQFKGWSAGIFTGSPELMKSVGLKTSRKHVFFNGAMECRLLAYQLY